jgi:hypothetical protein
MTEKKLEDVLTQVLDIKKFLLERIQARLWNLPDGKTVVRYSLPMNAFEVAADCGCDPLDPCLKPCLGD